MAEHGETAVLSPTSLHGMDRKDTISMVEDDSDKENVGNFVHAFPFYMQSPDSCVKDLPYSYAQQSLWSQSSYTDQRLASVARHAHEAGPNPNARRATWRH